MSAFTLEGFIKVSAQKAMQELDALDKKVDKVGKTVVDGESKFDKLSRGLNKFGHGAVNIGSKLTMGLTAPLVGLGGVCVKLASDLSEAMSKTQVVFEDTSETIMKWSKNLTESHGLAQKDALGTASTYAAMGKAMGLEKEDIDGYATSLTELSSDMASFHNTRMDIAQTALNGIYSGETESLKQFGIVMTEANLQEYAYAQGINKKVQDMTQAEKVQLRYNYVMSMSKDVMGDFQRTNDGLANSVRILQAKLVTLGERVGKVLEPVILAIGEKLKGLMDWLMSLSDEQLKWIVIIGGIIAIAGPLLMMLGFMTMGITALGSAFSLLASPVTLIILAIMALIAVGVLLYMNWETVKAKCGECWDWIKKKFQDFNTWITNIFTTDWSKNFGVFGDILNGFFSVCGDVWNNIKSIFSNIIEFVKNVFTGNWEGAWQNIVNIFDAIVSNIANIFKIPINAVIALMNGVIGAMNKMKIKTPDWLPGELGGKEFGINIPKFNYLYEGGIFNKPTLLGGGYGVGDRYNGQGNATEVVAPLEKLRQMIIDLLQVSIILNVDGYEFVKQVVAPHQDAIDRYNSRYV